MWFFICMVIVGLVVGMLVSAWLDDNLGGLAVLVMIAFVFIGALVSFTNVTSKDETTYHKLVSVNGYYVDYEGNFVTEDNLRGKIGSGAIPEKIVTKAPSIEKRHIVYVKSFFKKGGEKTEYSVVFR